jgi:predicted nucleotidyltransferase
MPAGVRSDTRKRAVSENRRITADAVVAALRAHEAELRAAGPRHLSLFGSAARGEVGVDSEVDLVAELDSDAHISLIRLASIEQRLRNILGRKVDLLTEPVWKRTVADQYRAGPPPCLLKPIRPIA